MISLIYLLNVKSTDTGIVYYQHVMTNRLDCVGFLYSQSVGSLDTFYTSTLVLNYLTLILNDKYLFSLFVLSGKLFAII